MRVKPPPGNVSPEVAQWMREAQAQINGLSEGTLSASYAARTAAPTTGTWAQGDTVRNSAPSELGAALSKYIITGWTCTVAGTPGTWLENRTLTGN
jgi:hypothetical protein